MDIVLESNLALYQKETSYQNVNSYLCWKVLPHSGLQSITSYCAEGKPLTIPKSIALLGIEKYQPHTMLEGVGLALNDTKKMTFRCYTTFNGKIRLLGVTSSLKKKPTKSQRFSSASKKVVQVMQVMRVIVQIMKVVQVRKDMRNHE